MARKKSKQKRYDSSLEKRLAEGPLKDCKYHPEKVQYEIPARKAKYEPDFEINNLLLEAKGRFRTMTEANKYKHVRDALEDKELVFVFQNPNTPMPGAVRRKDGSKRSMAEWAESQGFRWYSEKNVHELICRESRNAEK